MILLLQWQGATTVDVIEGGDRWMNVLTISADLDPNVYVLGPVRSVVDSHRLPLYAVTADEQQFFANNNVSTVYEPLLVPQDSGYNSGNLQIGESSADDNFSILQTFLLPSNHLMIPVE